MADKHKDVSTTTFLRNMEIAITEQELKFLKVLQRLDELGVDTSRYRENYEDESEDEYNYIACGQTAMFENGPNPLDKALNTPAVGLSLLSPSLSSFSGEMSKKQQHFQSTPALHLPTTSSNIACTPELFAPAEPKLLKYGIPVPSSGPTGGESAAESTKTSIPRLPGARKKTYAAKALSTPVTPKLATKDSFAKATNGQEPTAESSKPTSGQSGSVSIPHSPVTPTLSTEYSFLAPYFAAKKSGTAAVASSPVSPEEPILKTIRYNKA